MKVLSLFDGCATGLYVLKKLGIEVDKYYSSEIDKYAISVAMKNHPEIIQIGDIVNWKEWDIDWRSIDLVIGGSPCTGFSVAGKQLNFEDPQSKLFFEFMDILNHIKSLNSNVRFLLENVRMKKEYSDKITKLIGVDFIKIDASLVSAQSRVRYYWTNLGRINQPEDRGINLSDILEVDVADDKFFPEGHREYSNYKEHKVDKGIYQISPIQIGNSKSFGNAIKNSNKSYTLRASHPNGILDNNFKIRKFTPIECERLQGLPDNYTLSYLPSGKMINDNQRYKILGNGWNADVVEYILSFFMRTKYKDEHN